MPGSTNNFSSNISLALSAAPQGVYDPVQQSDMGDHFAATQTLSQILSDVITVRVLFLVGMTAGQIVSFSFIPGSGTEMIGVPCPAGGGSTPIGFLDADVLPGDYGIVHRSGICRQYSGLTFPAEYATAASGGVQVNPGSGVVRLGFSLDEHSIMFKGIL